MHGDISRILFDPTKHYSSVRSQQGRLEMDADKNDDVDIRLHDVRTGRIDVIGRHGAPEGASGMAITANGAGTSLEISPGCYYVDGIRCELYGEDPIDFTEQPHWPQAALPTEAGLYLIYLDVWERPITAVQDPRIREVALGGPDTTTRTQVVWQVKALPVVAPGPDPHCGTTFPEWDRLVAGPTGTLEVRVAEASGSAGPCIVPETAGFTGLKNELFRLQIHHGNFDPTSATGIDGSSDPDFKWSRDNGSVIAAWREHPSNLEVTVDRIGPGGANGFAPTDWIELTNDDDDLSERPGILAEVDDVQGDVLVLRDPPDLSVSSALQPVPQSDPERHTQARKWDSHGARVTEVAAADPDVTPDGFIRIVDGIEVRFTGDSFRSGDFWLVPARTAVLPGTQGRQIEWPTDGAGDPVPLPPHGPVHHRARIALADFDGTTWSEVRDCRRIFPALTDLVHLDGRGGDGQHARGNHWLPAPLCVGVSRGDNPVSPARVRFELLPRPGGAAIGELSVAEPSEDGVAPVVGTIVEAETDAQGIARVWWRVGPGSALEEDGDTYQAGAGQQVEATLLDGGGTPTNVRTRFVAQALDNVTLTPAGGDGQIGLPGETLEIALRVRIHDGTRPVEHARVLFSDLNRMLDGTNLDQFTGGAIHASANLVTFTPWPGGSRMMEAVVETDANGEAQVQFILGTEVGLPVQRVEAVLLDADGDPTAQRHLFTAHLSIAREIGWEPCENLLTLLDGEQDFHVQGALDALCQALAELQGFQAWVIKQLAALWQEVDGGRGPIVIPPNLMTLPALMDVLRDPDRFLKGFPPQPDLRGIDSRREGGTRRLTEATWVSGSGTRAPIGPDVEVPLGSLTRLEVRPNFTLPSVLSTGRSRLGVTVRAEDPVRAEDGGLVVGRQWIALDGRVAMDSAEGRMTWTPSRGATNWLRQRLAATDEPVALEIKIDREILTGTPGSPWTGQVFVTR